MPVSMPKSMPPKQAWEGVRRGVFWEGGVRRGFWGGRGMRDEGLTLAQRTKTRQL